MAAPQAARDRGLPEPQDEEISTGPRRRSAPTSRAPLLQLRADLDAPTGFAAMMRHGASRRASTPSRRRATRRLQPGPGLSAGHAHRPRPAVVRQGGDRLDTPCRASSWRLGGIRRTTWPGCGTAGRRRGRMSGPTSRARRRVLMDRPAGSDAARRRFEARTTPAETEAVSAELLPTPGQHLGDPIDYGAYLMGQLTGHWTTPNGVATYVANDHAAPLPDFNLDSDRGYAYQCWDYMRHAESKPRPTPGDARRPGDALAGPVGMCPADLQPCSRRSRARPRRRSTRVRDWYGYPEPCTVPAAYRREGQPASPVALRPAETARPLLPAAGWTTPTSPRGGTGSTSRWRGRDARRRHVADRPEAGAVSDPRLPRPGPGPDPARSRADPAAHPWTPFGPGDTTATPDPTTSQARAAKTRAVLEKAQVELTRMRHGPGPDNTPPRSSRPRAPTACGRSC